MRRTCWVLVLGLTALLQGVVADNDDYYEGGYGLGDLMGDDDYGFAPSKDIPDPAGKDVPLSKDTSSTDTPLPSPTSTPVSSPSSSPIPTPSHSPIPSPSSTPGPSPSSLPSTSPLPTVEELVKELNALRQRVAELEAEAGSDGETVFTPELARLVAAGVPHSAAAYLPESVYAAIQKTAEQCHEDAVALCGAPDYTTDVGLPMDRFPGASMCFERFAHSSEVSDGCKDAARSIVWAVQSVPDVNLFVAGSRAVLSESYNAFMTDCSPQIRVACSVDETSPAPQLPTGYGDDMMMMHGRHHGGPHHGGPHHGGPHHGGPGRRLMEMFRKHRHGHHGDHHHDRHHDRHMMEKFHKVHSHHGHGHHMRAGPHRPEYQPARRLHEHEHEHKDKREHEHKDGAEREDRHGRHHESPRTRDFYHDEPEKPTEDLSEHPYDSSSTTYTSDAPEGVTPELSYCIKKIVAWNPSLGTCRHAAQNMAGVGSRIYKFDFVTGQPMDGGDWNDDEDDDGGWHGHHRWHHDRDHDGHGGVLLVLIVVGLSVFCCIRRRRRIRKMRRRMEELAAAQRNQSAATVVIDRSAEVETKADAPSAPVRATATAAAAAPLPPRARAVPPAVPTAPMPVVVAANAPAPRSAQPPVAYASVPTSYSMLPRHLQQTTYAMPITGQAPQYFVQQQPQQPNQQQP